jgi:hypothetical protein
MAKKRLLYFIIFFIIINIVSAELKISYEFTTEDGPTQNDVIVVWYACTNSDCTEVKDNPISDLFSPNPKFISPGEELTMTYPDCPETEYGYFPRFFLEEYRSRDQNPYTYDCYYSSHTYPKRTITFDRKDNCKAEFTPTIQSCAEAGLPLSILTDTQLSAETKSAFIPSNDFYYPSTYYDPDYSGENFDEWIGVDTEMRVDVTPQGSSSSVSGFPTSDTFDIYTDQTHDFSFLWQTSKDTSPGTYEVTMTSTVPDAKCDQSNDVPVTKSFDVYCSESGRMCGPTQ